jgi:hypothetical protein
LKLSYDELIQQIQKSGQQTANPQSAKIQIATGKKEEDRI